MRDTFDFGACTRTQNCSRRRGRCLANQILYGLFRRGTSSSGTRVGLNNRAIYLMLESVVGWLCSVRVFFCLGRNLVCIPRGVQRGQCREHERKNIKTNNTP